MADPAVAAGSASDAGAFLARLIRLDPSALVRLRPSPGDGRIELWGQLPFDVLVTRMVDGVPGDDVTLRADALLGALPDGPLPVRFDADWRGGLPPATGTTTVESVPADALRDIAGAAARTLREASGRGVGERRLRDAILDHVAITLSAGEPPRQVAVPTRVVTGLARMGFIGTDPVRFATIGPWLVAHATFGAAWYRTSAGLRLEVATSG